MPPQPPSQGVATPTTDANAVNVASTTTDTTAVIFTYKQNRYQHLSLCQSQRHPRPDFSSLLFVCVFCSSPFLLRPRLSTLLCPCLRLRLPFIYCHIHHHTITPPSASPSFHRHRLRFRQLDSNRQRRHHRRHLHQSKGIVTVIIYCHRR